MGIFSSIGKFFKKVRKSKIFQAVAAVAGVAATVFTVGAASGASWASGGWGGAVSSVTQSLGLGDTVTNLLTGAVTAAGYSAAIGAAGAALTGGDILEGAASGAAIGGLIGGAAGAAGYNVDPLDGINTKGASGVTSGAAQGVTGGARLPSELNLDGAGAEGMTYGGERPTFSLTSPPAPTPAAPETSASEAGGSSVMGRNGADATGGGILDRGGFLDRNSSLIGRSLTGLAAGYAQGADNEDEIGEIRRQEDRRRASYDIDFGAARDRGRAATSGAPTAAERYRASKRAASPGGFTFRWDRGSRQMVRVPVGG